MPDLSSGSPTEVWDKFFSEHRPAPALVGRWVLKLNNQKDYKQVIACLQSALIHGQAQPWMYEVLALTMEIENYPKESIERVVLSLTDFGEVDYGSMLYSGAYLTKFGRKRAALTLYEQAARLLPERPEPYLFGLKLAQEVGQPEEVRWTAEGLLLNYWGPDYAQKQRTAEDALLEAVSQLKKQGNSQQAEAFEKALVEAKSRDLVIRLDWNGDADLDLQVEEPAGTVCSVVSPQTQGGGLHLHDGLGPDKANAYELYVCPRGAAGPYRVGVHLSSGTLVGNRATLTITIREGLNDQVRYVRTLVFDGEDAGLTVDLPQGRRTQPRLISEWPGRGLMEMIEQQTASIRVPQVHDPRAAQALKDFEESRAESDRRNGRRAGAVGYAPIIQVIPEGSMLSAQPVISADRRYVRLGIQPVFQEITDVFTFSFINGGGAQSQPAQGR